MSMSAYVWGLKPVTEDYKKRLEIYKTCRELKINPPEEIRKYFEDDGEPCDEGIIVRLKDNVVRESSDANYCREYYDVDLSKLPEGISKVRFVISY